MTITTVDESKVTADMPPQILNETDDKKLVRVGKLVADLPAKHGARHVQLTRQPTGDVLITVDFTDNTTPAAGPERAHQYRSALPSTLVTDISVEDALVYFTIPHAVAGDHGKVGTYTNHKCRGPLCRMAWRDWNQAMKVARQEELKRNFNAVQHGRAATYTNWGCSCEPCRRAWAADALDRKNVGRLRKAFAALKADGAVVTLDENPNGVRVTAVATKPETVAAVHGLATAAKGTRWSATGTTMSWTIPRTYAAKLKLTPK